LTGDEETEFVGEFCDRAVLLTPASTKIGSSQRLILNRVMK